MALNAFYRTACKTLSVWFPTINNPSANDAAVIDPPPPQARLLFTNGFVYYLVSSFIVL